MHRVRFMVAALIAWAGVAYDTSAAITVRATGPGGSAVQTLPDTGGSFDMNLPLNANAVNQITVSATDSASNRVEKKKLLLKNPATAAFVKPARNHCVILKELIVKH